MIECREVVDSLKKNDLLPESKGKLIQFIFTGIIRFWPIYRNYLKIAQCRRMLLDCLNGPKTSLMVILHQPLIAMPTICALRRTWSVSQLSRLILTWNKLGVKSLAPRVTLEQAVNNPDLISQSPANELFCNLDGNRDNQARRKSSISMCSWDQQDFSTTRC